MKKKLLFMRDPLFSAYTIYGSMFSITQDNILPWIYNQMTQMIYVYPWNLYTFNIHYSFLLSCPFIKTVNLPKESFITKNRSVIDVIIDAIDSEQYVLMNVDRIYIPTIYSDQKIHSAHEIFVYGYDLDKKILHAADNAKYGKYIRMAIPFHEIEAAYNNLELKTGYETSINFLSLVEDVHIEINMEQIINGIESYLQAKPITIYEEKCDYGLDAVYRIYHNKVFDIRAFHILYEHKMLMRMRMEYLVKNTYIRPCDQLIKDYTKIETNYLVLRNMILKHYVSKNEGILQSVRKKIFDFIPIEKELLTTFLSVLKDKQR